MAVSIAIAGAGFSGAVIAHRLATAGLVVDLYDERSHVGGNCYTERDAETGILLHRYGPHIFHTDNAEVWNLVTRLAEFVPFTNRVKANANGAVYSLPINLHTINQFYNTTLSPTQARELINLEADQSIREPTTFEEQALRFIGAKLYRAFFYGYTRKQWGCEPSELPASILKRLPVRFNYDDNYFCHRYQGIPKQGYTPIFEKLLDHSNISVHLNCPLPKDHLERYDHTFYSGPIDRYFNYCMGDLGYRTLRFEEERHVGDYQGCGVMNYCDLDIPYTRITEHKYFSPWEAHDKTVVYKEYSDTASRGDIPFYPTRLAGDKLVLAKYIELATVTTGVSFVGRLGTYRYIDMDVTIAEAIHASTQFLECRASNRRPPAFFVAPI